MWESHLDQPATRGSMEKKVVYFANPLQDAIPGLDFLPLRAGHTKTDPGYRKESVMGDAHVMMFIVEGCGVLQTDRVTIPFSAGDVVGFFADEICRWRSKPHSPLEHYWIGLTGEGGRGILSPKLVQFRICPAPARVPPREKRLLETLLTSFQNRSAHCVWSTLSCCFAIFDSVAQSYSPPCDDPGQGMGDLADQTRRFIEKNFSQPLTMTDMASLAGTSIEHLRRAFSEAYGMTPYAYLTSIRLQRRNTCYDVAYR